MSFMAAAPAVAEAAGAAGATTAATGAGLGAAGTAAGTGAGLGTAGSGVLASAAGAPAFEAGGFGIGAAGGEGLGMMSAANTASPTFVEGMTDMLKRFRSGGEQSLGDAYKNFGNNPETYGYLSGKAGELAKTGQQNAPVAPIVYPSYQQPENPYLKRRGY